MGSAGDKKGRRQTRTYKRWKKILFEGYDFSDDANDVQSPVRSDLIVAKIKCKDCVQKDLAEEIAMKLFQFVKPECVLLKEEPEDIMNDDDIEHMTTM